MLGSIIKSIIDREGNNYLKEPQFINELADRQAFQENPAAKFVLKTIVNEGYLDILTHISSNSYPQHDAEKILNDLYIKFGFRKDISMIVLNALLFALDCPILCLDNQISKHQLELHESHIIFSGISLKHSINDIAKHMLYRGFKIVKEMPYRISMLGTFCNIDNVELFINGSALEVTKDIVLQIKEHHPTCLFIGYSSKLYNLLFNKYGAPSDIYDPFDTVHKDFDYYKNNVLKYSDLVSKYEEIYNYKWSVNGGDIVLKWIGERMILKYSDTQNIEKAELFQERFNEESI